MNNLKNFDLSSLNAAIECGLEPEFVFFWKPEPKFEGVVDQSCLCQWWPSPFEVDGVVYLTAEHIMMAEKAHLFGDEETRRQILLTADPHLAKKLGRSVRGFDGKVWLQHRIDIVVQANLAKFGQHPRLKHFLLDTGESILVEASPFDRIWGIGLAEDDPCATNPKQWRGLNLLGFALMTVRSMLR